VLHGQECEAFLLAYTWTNAFLPRSSDHVVPLVIPVPPPLPPHPPFLMQIAEQGTEEFYAVRWGRYEDTGAPLLLAAGLEGVCRVLDCNAQKLLWASLALLFLSPPVIYTRAAESMTDVS